MTKTILITGAGTGFGKGIAFKLAKANYQVIATTESYAQIFALEKEAKKEKLTNITFEKLDVTCPGDRAKAKAWDIDILLNNAGVSEGGSVLDVPEKTMHAQFDVNVFGPILLTQIVTKKMIQMKKGKVVFMSSVAGLTVDPFTGTYSASKHALEAYAEALYKEVRGFNIEVATINPGPILTGFNDRMFETHRGWNDDPKKRVFDYSQLHYPFAQYDPQIVIDASVDVITGKTTDYRTVLPKEFEAGQKEKLEAMWTLQSADKLGKEFELIQVSREMAPETPVKD